MLKRWFYLLLLFGVSILTSATAENFFANYGNNLHQYVTNNHVGLKNSDGIQLIEASCDYISPRFVEGLAIYKQNGKYGYYNDNGGIISPPVWLQAADFCEGRAAVIDERGMVGFLDSYGNHVIPNNWKYCPSLRFSDGLALVLNQEDEYFYINYEGEVVIELNDTILQATDFKNNYALLQAGIGENYVYSVIDKQGLIRELFRSSMFNATINEDTIMLVDQHHVIFMKVDKSIIFDYHNTII